MRRAKGFSVEIQALRRRFDRKRGKLDAGMQAVREALIVDLEDVFEFVRRGCNLFARRNIMDITIAAKNSGNKEEDCDS